MNTISSGAAAPVSPQPIGQASAAATHAQASAKVDLPSGTAPRDTIDISGDALLRSRLFPGLTGDLPTATDNSPSVYKFLTSSDRAVISKLYKSASDSGGDLKQVDALAFDLGAFRSSPPGMDKVGMTFDESGAPIVYAFSPVDEATAQRILTSKAMADTRIPTDFLRHFLDAGLAGGSHASDFAALEKMVYATSAVGSDGATDPQAVLAPRPAERLTALKASGRMGLAPADAVPATDPRGVVGKFSAQSEAVDRAAALVALFSGGSDARGAMRPRADAQHLLVDVPALTRVEGTRTGVDSRPRAHVEAPSAAASAGARWLREAAVSDGESSLRTSL
jgi:hypothetical protein